MKSSVQSAVGSRHRTSIYLLDKAPNCLVYPKLNVNDMHSACIQMHSVKIPVKQAAMTERRKEGKIAILPKK
jgi:hypothetical protein